MRDAGSAAPFSAGTRWWQTRRSAAAAVVLLLYALILFVPHLSKHPEPLQLTFNSMLDHLLHGRFDVDPAIVGMEGFGRNGRVYSYWGIMPALLRLPVTVLPHWQRLNFTVAYCSLAVLLMAAVKLWTVHYVARRHPELPRPLVSAVYVVVAFSGAQVCFIKPSVFQEVCLWAGLCGAIFVAAAVVGLHDGLGRRARLVMAAAAGAAILTRVSTGIGLIAAFGLLLLAALLADRANWRVHVRRSVLPVVVLAATVALTAWVNYNRWDDPLTFADYRYYLYNQQFPDRLGRTVAYGLFNVQRIPFGLAYYFLPIWVFGDGSGGLLLEATRDRLIDSAELPPSSFLLTDPLLLLLGGFAVAQWLRRRDRPALLGGTVAVGLAAPVVLMLTAISMCFRYRIDFYPLIDFLAFSGLAAAGNYRVTQRRGLIWTLAGISVVCSIAVTVLYFKSGFGPGQLLIADGVGDYYRHRFHLK